MFEKSTGPICHKNHTCQLNRVQVAILINFIRKIKMTINEECSQHSITIPMIFSFELVCFAYLMDCIPFWIQFLVQHYQIENESRPHCLMRHGWEELNHHNTFPSWMMYLNPHHKWSRNQSWKTGCLFFSFDNYKEL